jgi:NAD(P)H-flavin reductase
VRAPKWNVAQVWGLLASENAWPHSFVPMSPLRQSARLIAVRDLSPNVKELSLAPAQPLAFVAGQWVNVYVPSRGTFFKRAYSVANAPGAPHLELAVTHVEDGAASPVLHALQLGQELDVDGPYGLFTRSSSERSEPALFVATGTGLAPFRAMLQDELATPSDVPITVLFGCRSAADILWQQEFEGLCRRFPRLSTHVSLSRPDAAWTGLRGYVQHHLPTLVPKLGMPHVYVCGLTRMVSEVRRVLKEELGYDRKRIHSERYD